MVKLLLQIAGWLLARSPEFLVRGLTAAVATVFYYVVGSRRRVIHSNLHHAFPARSAKWRSATARECVRRFVETALYSVASPYFSEARIRRIAHGTESLRAAFAAHRAQPQPTLFCAPHFAHWETQTALSLLVEAPFPEFASIYRPIDNVAADQFIKKSRERFGMRMLSRRQGFQEAMKLLRGNGCLAILHDQNAGESGALTLLFDRLCSTTELPGILAQKFNAAVYVLYPRYLGFWKVELNVERITTDGTSEGVTIALNRWLEERVTQDDNQCRSWLWGHQRWKSQSVPAVRFRIEQKRDLLAAEMRHRQLATLPRRLRLWIRLPDQLREIVQAFSFLRAIRTARPDAEITLVAASKFVPLLELLALADRHHAVTEGAIFSSLVSFARARQSFPDCYLLLTDSMRADLEAWLTGAPQRFGLRRPGKPRPLLSHRCKLAANFDEAPHHQTARWTELLRHFGLTEVLDFSPLSLSGAPRGEAIGLFCGPENSSAQRWPVQHWRALIAALPELKFELYGTANDAPLTTEIAAGFGDRVSILAGQTDLVEFAKNLQKCRVLVSNDTDEFHLANALGVPVVGLFGSSNPVRTGPIFSGPAQILPAAGSLTELSPETVTTAVRQLLQSNN